MKAILRRVPIRMLSNKRLPRHPRSGTKGNRYCRPATAHGADPSLPNDEGKSAIALAREKGHTEFADWLASKSPTA